MAYGVRLIGPATALLLSFGIAGVIVMALGIDPSVVFRRFMNETVGTAYGTGQILFKATPLMLTGLAAGIAFRAGLFNVGAEGQLIVGGFLTALVGFTWTALPAIILLPCSLLAGMLGGAIWGMIPGYLKARFGSHEVINTIMMNFIAAALVSFLVSNIFAVPATIRTPEIAFAATIPRLEEFIPGFQGAPVNLTLLLALTACACANYLFRRTRTGYELRVLGANPQAAEYAGINTGARTILAMGIAGACAGIAGSNFVLGYKHYYELGFSEGVGFIGIAVALLTNNHPIGIVVAALFFGMLEYGGLVVNTMVPKEIITILQATIILLMIIMTRMLRPWTSRLEAALLGDTLND